MSKSETAKKYLNQAREIIENGKGAGGQVVQCGARKAADRDWFKLNTGYQLDYVKGAA